MKPRRIVDLVAAALLVAACSGGPGSAVGSTTPAPARQTAEATDPPEATCTLATVKTYEDLVACRGTSEQFSLEVAESRQGKTVAKIIIPSKDPDTILGAMGASTTEWSIGADSFTLWAYGSRADAEESGYSRGRIFWNNGGQIEVKVCTAISVVEASDGSFEFCDEEATIMLTNE